MFSNIILKVFVSDSPAENNGLVIHGKKQSPFLSSCRDATFDFLEVVGTQAGKEKEAEPSFLPEEGRLD